MKNTVTTVLAFLALLPFAVSGASRTVTYLDSTLPAQVATPGALPSAAAKVQVLDPIVITAPKPTVTTKTPAPQKDWSRVAPKKTWTCGAPRPLVQGPVAMTVKDCGWK